MSNGTMLKIDKEGNLTKSSADRSQKEIKKNRLSNVNIGVGFYLLTPILLGLGIGLLLDRWFNTKPFLTLLFLLLGVISSFYNIWKIAQEK